MDLRDTPVEVLAEQVRAKKVSARDLTHAALAAIEDRNPTINAFVALDGERALAEAAALDERIAAGEYGGMLAGIPIGVKDLEDAAGFVTSEGSFSHANDPPAPTDSPLVARLRAAGCIVLGKTNTPEFGWKGDTENPVFGATRNPWDPALSAGGSSGGTGAAIAAGMVPLGTGSDGGGSIRIPSSVNGLSGLKPSLGRVPSGGRLPAGWQDLSTKGPMARRIRDVALALDAVLGPEPTDLRSLPMPEASWRAALDGVAAPLRVLWCPSLGYADIDGEVLSVCDSAVKALESNGTEVVAIDSVWDTDPVTDWLAQAVVYNLRSLGHLRDTPDWDRLDPGLVALMEWADDHVDTVRLVRAQDAGHYMNLRLVELFHRAPLLLCPTVAGQVGPVGEQGTINGAQTPQWISMTYGFNMTRSPAGTVTAGFSSAGMPIGLQVIGPQHGDLAVLRCLAFLEDILAVDTRCADSTTTD